MTNNILINKELVRDSFGKSFRLYPDATIIQPEMTKHLIELLLKKVPNDSYPNILELGCGCRSTVAQLLQYVKTETVTANDLVDIESVLTESLSESNIDNLRFIQGDMESALLPDAQDLIISNASFQWLTDPSSFITSLIDKLSPNGVLAFSSFGPENLHELRDLTNTALNYIAASEYENILKDYGDIICVDEQLSELSFDSPGTILRHLKQTGVNAVSRKHWTKSRLKDFYEAYISRFSKDNKVTLTYHPIYVIFQKQ